MVVGWPGCSFVAYVCVVFVNWCFGSVGRCARCWCVVLVLIECCRQALLIHICCGMCVVRVVMVGVVWCCGCMELLVVVVLLICRCYLMRCVVVVCRCCVSLLSVGCRCWLSLLVVVVVG